MWNKQRGEGEKKEGKCTWSNGKTFDGTFNGDGTKYKGITTYLNGNKFDGTYYDNGEKWKGTYTFRRGTIYKGEIEAKIPSETKLKTITILGEAKK